MAFDGTLKFDTAIDKSGFNTGLEGLGKLAKSGISGIGSAAKAGMAAVTAAVTAASGAVVAFGTKAVTVGKEFEAGMSQVQATLGITVNDLKNNIDGAAETMDALTAKAEEMGATTQYTAAQAADGLNTLAMSGYDAAESIDMIENVLNAAAAGNLTLAQSAQYITGSMKGFTEEAGNFADAAEASAYYADMIAKGATLAATNVAGLGEAMSGSAAIANSYKQSSLEAEVALLRLAEQGETGSAAATMLSATMKNLYTPTDQAREALDKLGVKAYDDAGKMREFNTVVDELHAALSEYDPETASSLEDAIFGIQGKEGFDKMVVSSREKVQSFYDGLAYNEDGAMGSAAAQAEAMMDNLAGDITYLESAADGLYNTLYKSMNGSLRELVQLGNGYVTAINDAFRADGFEGAAAAVGSALGDAVTHIGDYLPDVTGIGTSIVSSLLAGISDNSGSIIQQGLDMGLTLLQGAGDISVRFLELGANLLTNLADGIDGKKLRIRRILREVLRETLEAIDEHLPEMLTAGGEIVETLGGALLDNLDLLLGIGAGIVGAIVQALTEPDTLAGMSSAAVQLLTTLGAALLSGIPLLLSAGVQLLGALVDSLSDPDALNGLLDAGLTILTALAEILTENLSPLLGAVIAIIGALGSWLGEHALDLVQAGLAIVQALLDAVIENLPLLLDAAVQIIEALCKGIEEDSGDVLIAVEQIIRTLLDFLLSPDTLKMLGSAGGRIIRALIPAAKELAGDLLGFAYDFFSEFGTALFTPDWDELGKNIVYGILSGILGVDFDAELFKSDFAENWVSGFKDIFGIHSPSKLMEDEIGRNLALGIEVGFSENIPDIGGEVETALTELPDVPVLTVGVDVQEPEPVPVSFTGDAPEPDTPGDITIPVDYDLPELSDPDPITVSLTDDAARILEELRAAQVPVTPNIDPAALEALHMTPIPDASALVPQSATSVVNNSYYNSYQSSTTMSSTTTNQTTGGTAPSGDIVTNVYLGDEKLETVVMHAIELANARSGGGAV